MTLAPDTSLAPDTPLTDGAQRDRRWWAPSRWTLRVRLLVALTALLAAVSVVVVVVTTVALRGYLLDQVDERLAATDRFAPSTEVRPPPGIVDPLITSPEGPAPGSAFAAGQGTGTLSVWLADGEVSSVHVLAAGPEPELPVPDALAELADVPVDGEAHSVTFDGLGDYRVLATSQPYGRVRITGVPLDEVNETTMWMVAVGGLVALVGTAAAGLVGAIIIRRTLRPLRRVATTASRVTALPLDRGEVALVDRVPDLDTDPRTEVGQVGAALNLMLGHVEAALAARHASETRVRQFVADASHELRTPLAAISGYAQLTRRTRDPVPGDVAYAMGRVESESARMTSLVEDLLLLARLDSGRPLTREPVDVSRLVVDAVSDAHVAAPGHRFALDLPDDPVCIPGDAARLHQVLANLLANARTHTPPGTRVVTRLEVDCSPGVGCGGPGPGDSPSAVRLIVADDGPGIPADLLPDVFERFARGEASRTRASGSTSTGLGLAIVAAVVDAHQGSVEAASVPGRTVMTVRLPVRAVDTDTGTGIGIGTGTDAVLEPAHRSARRARGAVSGGALVAELGKPAGGG